MLIIVRSDHGNFIRHRRAAAPARIQNLQSALIVARHHPDRLGQRSNPSRQPLLFQLPVIFIRRAIRWENVALPAGADNHLFKGYTSFIKSG